ncbi:hypothetical protein [Halobacillus ihumii]|uniref:hypothetical protein n=1 Tax=Halobacillus ihumii TaxID=2686092 RepID=UPI0013D4B847|nr:hypothetical protein [Halobacillus ihumii]
MKTAEKDSSIILSENERKLYNKGHYYIRQIFKMYSVLPKFETVKQVMLKEQKSLCRKVGKEKVEAILQKLHRNWRRYFALSKKNYKVRQPKYLNRYVSGL